MHTLVSFFTMLPFKVLQNENVPKRYKRSFFWIYFLYFLSLVIVAGRNTLLGVIQKNVTGRERRVTIDNIGGGV